MTDRIATFPVMAKGVGRVDYSSAVEVAVESTVRSYQQTYTDWNQDLILAGATQDFDFIVPSGFVVIAYDYYCSFPADTLAQLLVITVDAGVPVNIAVESRYGSIHLNMPKGFSFVDTCRLQVSNLDLGDEIYTVGLIGIICDLPRYRLLTP
jgi:hypothetical protein